jgi:hypothetical protein
MYMDGVFCRKVLVRKPNKGVSVEMTEESLQFQQSQRLVSRAP